MTADTQQKVTIVGSAFAAGGVEALAYRSNGTLGTLVTFGGGLLGLFAALSGRGTVADAGLGVAASSAGSMGHFAVMAWWPKKTGRPIGRLGTGDRPALRAGTRVGGLENTEVVRDQMIV
ncbi:MAG: hypothetical protein V2A77_00550 [Pseudomonadota bacterium]